jgi:hypothetical protein
MRPLLSQSRTPTASRKALGFFRFGCPMSCLNGLVTQLTLDRPYHVRQPFQPSTVREATGSEGILSTPIFGAVANQICAPPGGAAIAVNGEVSQHFLKTDLHDAHRHFFSRSTGLIGRSQCASRIAKRRCSSCVYVSWSGNNCFFKASSSNVSLATAAFLKTIVTR